MTAFFLRQVLDFFIIVIIIIKCFKNAMTNNLGAEGWFVCLSWDHIYALVLFKWKSSNMCSPIEKQWELLP